MPLASVTEGAAVPNAVAEVLGVQETARRSLTESIVGAIAGRDLLLILDNCEHVLDGARRLAQAIMGECAPVVVMATSREPLAVSGERVFPVEPLPTEGTSGSGVGPAVELFVTRRGLRIRRSSSTTRLSTRYGLSAPTSMACRWRSSWRPPGSGGSASQG